MSEGRRKRKPGGAAPGGRRLGVIVGIAVGLLLAANLVVSLIKTSDLGDPAGFLTPEMLLGAAFWVPVVVLLLMAGLAVFWCTAAWERTERPGIRWHRRAFLFTLIATMCLVMASWEPEVFRRTEITTLAVFVLAVQTLLFALGARSDHLGQGSRGGRRRSRDRDRDRDRDDDDAEAEAADAEERLVHGRP